MENAHEIIRICTFLSFMLIICDFFIKSIPFKVMRICYLMGLYGCLLNGGWGDLVIGFLIVMAYLEGRKNHKIKLQAEKPRCKQCAN